MSNADTEIKERHFVDGIKRDNLLRRYRMEQLEDGSLRPVFETDEPDLFPAEILGKAALGE